MRGACPEDDPYSGSQWGLMFGALLLAIVSARPYPGSWNDGSRLATVESLAERATFIIDDSIFTRSASGDSNPYPEHDPLLRHLGTLDRLWINSHYYSDKSPVPALPLAGLYRLTLALSGPTAREWPAGFCLLMTWASSGLAYAVAVGCIHRLGTILELSPRLTLGLTLSFGLSTVALPYTRHVNNHVLLLGVSAALTLCLVSLGQGIPRRWPGLAGAGCLAGAAYTIDLGAGPVIFVAATAYLLWQYRSVWALAIFGLAALPWMGLHHILNGLIGGTVGPANAVPEYLAWPGSPFTAATMTGGWKHPHVGHFLIYSLSLLVGQRGFLGHNPALFLVPWGSWLLLRRGRRGPELLFALAVCAGVWLMYAANSNNSSGRCLSVRWFVPLLAPGYLLLAYTLKDHPRLVAPFVVLSAWGAVLMAFGWWNGPWEKIRESILWPIRIGAVLSLVLVLVRQRRPREVQAERPRSMAA